MCKFFLFSSIPALSLLLTSMASATPVSGVASISGTFNLSPKGIFFSDTHLSGFKTGSFAAATGVTLSNLVGMGTTGPVNLPDLASFTTPNDSISFDLKNISPGTGTAGDCGSNAIGNVCTRSSTGSPFTLTQTAPGEVTLSLLLSGILYSGTSANGSSPALFAFSIQNFVPGTITGILSQVNTEEGLTNSFSATLGVASSVPEPNSTWLLITGFLVAGLLTCRKVRSSVE